MISFLENITAIRPWLSPMVCGEVQLALLHKAAEMVPYLPTGALEFRLDGIDMDVDFGALAVYERNEFELILRFYEEQEHIDSLEWRNEIQTIYGFLRQKILLPNTLKNCWISFDLSSNNGIRPYIFFGMGRFPRNPSIKLITCETILSAQGKELTDEESDLLFLLLSHLPKKSTSFLTFIGDLSSRGKQLIRTTFFWEGDFNSFMDYLDLVQWEGDIHLYHTLLENLFELSVFTQFTLDFSTKLERSISIECWPGEEENAIRSAAMFDLLIAQNLCMEEKKKPHLEWIGESTQGQRLVKRRINHVKLTFKNDNSVVSKVYYAFSNHLQNKSH
ncbi:MAG: hypothetical protein AAFY71_11415 [Bacteroidota bacterium]